LISAFCHRSQECSYALGLFSIIDKFADELRLSFVFFRKPLLFFSPLALFLAAARPLLAFQAILLDRSRCNLDPN
jgi:hypothetical protein